MRVKLLYFDGCPQWQAADHRLRALATELGFQLERQVITGLEDAKASGFHGSPTVLVDGHDPFANNGEPHGLSCRIYQTPAGPAGAPTVEQLRGALRA